MKIKPAFDPDFYVELPDDIDKEQFHDLLILAIIEKIKIRSDSGWPGGVYGLDGDWKFQNWNWINKLTSKKAGAWLRDAPGLYQRADLQNKGVNAASVWWIDHGSWDAYIGNTRLENFPDAQAAMAAADKELFKQNWTLINEFKL